MPPPLASPPTAQHPPEKKEDYGRFAGVAAFLLFALVLLVVRALPREASRDEEQFISAGALLLREGLLPYVDYPYFHLPNLAFVYAALFAASDHLLLAARSFNVLCGWLTVLLVFAVAAREFRAAGPARWWLAMAAAAALLASPLFRLTSGSAWNHDFAVLTATAAFVALLRASEAAARSRSWIIAAGTLLGIAIGTRLSFLPLALPFALMVTSTAATTRSRLAQLALFSLATAMALAPTLVLCARAPAEFFFDNFIYNGPLNRAYRTATGNPGVELPAKLLFAVRLLKFPHNIALLAAFVYLAVWLPARHGWRAFVKERKVAAAVFCVAFLWIGTLAPSPSYKQYYYALVPFVVLGCVFALAHALRSNDGHKARLVWNALAAASALALVTDLPLLRHLASPRDWPPVRIHALGRELRTHTSGPVLTLSPLLPLEASLDIYKEFATGPFAWRTAAFLSPERKAEFRMVDAARLDQFLASAPPAAILTPVTQDARERPLAVYAERHAYRRVPLRHDLDLWIRDP
jgi:hypothetical protein